MINKQGEITEKEKKKDTEQTQVLESHLDVQMLVICVQRYLRLLGQHPQSWGDCEFALLLMTGGGQWQGNKDSIVNVTSEFIVISKRKKDGDPGNGWIVVGWIIAVKRHSQIQNCHGNEKKKRKENTVNLTSNVSGRWSLWWQKKYCTWIQWLRWNLTEYVTFIGFPVSNVQPQCADEIIGKMCLMIWYGHE